MSNIHIHFLYICDICVSQMCIRTFNNLPTRSEAIVRTIRTVYIQNRFSLIGFTGRSLAIICCTMIIYLAEDTYTHRSLCKYYFLRLCIYCIYVRNIYATHAARNTSINQCCAIAWCLVMRSQTGKSISFELHFI